nr:zinc transporter ZIP3 isoform X1 [Taeniopygia guttata]
MSPKIPIFPFPTFTFWFAFFFSWQSKTQNSAGKFPNPRGICCWEIFIPDFFGFFFFFLVWFGFFLFFEDFQANSSFFCSPFFPIGSHFQEVFESLEFPGFSTSRNEDFPPNLGFLGILLLPSLGSVGQSGLSLPQAFFWRFPIPKKSWKNPAKREFLPWNVSREGVKVFLVCLKEFFPNYFDFFSFFNCMSMVNLAGLERIQNPPLDPKSRIWAGRISWSQIPAGGETRGNFFFFFKSRMDLNPIFGSWGRRSPSGTFGRWKKSWKKVIFFGRGSVEFVWFVSLVRNKNHLDTLVVIPACSEPCLLYIIFFHRLDASF